MKKTNVILMGFMCLFGAGGMRGQDIPPQGAGQIRALLAEKMQRTPAQRKLDTHLHWAGQVARGLLSAPQIPLRARQNGLLRFDVQRRVHVDIRARVTDALLDRIAALGGTVESSHPKYNAIRAWMPLLQVETLAGGEDVDFIEPAEVPMFNGPARRPVAKAQAESVGSNGGENLRRQLRLALTGEKAMPVSPLVLNSAPVDTDALVSHGADLVQAQGTTGSGVKVGVLSDGVDSLAAMQGAGNLPSVTVISGQAGSGDEGTAMLEIVYDLAPGAQLYFATGASGEAQMAANIEALASAGCTIIVDDVTYFGEGVFQDGPIAQEITTAKANGVLYFSSAANSGNLDSSTSGTWEGDFNGTGAAIAAVNTAEGKTVTIHAFDVSHNYDTVTAASSSGNPTFLQWADPLGGACDDYDLFVMNNTLTTILDASTNAQSCSQDPYEQVAAPSTGEVLVIALVSGSARAMHLDTGRGRLSINTAGSTFGHNAGKSTVTVAATPAQSSIFTSGNQSPETYSSDGPRRIFYYPLGTPITSGNFLFGTNGGTNLSKVDLTAADCGQSAVSGFNPFCGTSAAAPTAAAIAALVKSAQPSMKPDDILATLKNTALPAHAGFNTRTVGAGIVMANLAVNSVLFPVASISPRSLFFTGQPVGTNSFSQSVTLTNTGGASLSISNYAIAGGDSGDFSVSSACPASLAAGNNCTFAVSFKPTAPGPRKSSLRLSDNASDSPQKIILTGLGTGATVSPAAMSFASRTVGTTSAAMTATITNNSASVMHLWKIVINGPQAGDFPWSTNCGNTLAVGANCTVSVSFKPTDVGARTATLLFSDDAPDTPQAVALSGGGLDTIITIGPGNAVNGTLSPSAAAGHCNYNAPSDRYLLDLSGQGSPTVVTFQMSLAAFDTFVCVLNASNAILAQDDDSGGGTNGTDSNTTLSLIPGKYYVEASSFSGSGSGAYTLSALVATIATPGSLSTGNRAVAILSTNAAVGSCSFFNTGNPTDLWTFSLATNTTVTIDVSSWSFDSQVCLDGGTTDSDSGPGTNARLTESLGVGSHSIQVSSKSAGTAGAYTLSLQLGIPPAKPISVSNILSGRLSTTAAEGTCSFFNTGNPTDLWKFHLATTTTVTIDVTSSVFDTQLCLDGGTTDSDSGPGNNARLTESLGVGDHYIEVSSKSAGIGGAYTLSVQSGLPPATPISVGQTLSGNLSTNAAEGTCSFFNTGNPTDLWIFHLTTTTTVTIDVTSSVFDTQVCLDGGTTDSDSGPGNNARLTVSLGVGDHYIQVSSKSAGTGGAYTLSLQLGPPPGMAISVGQTLPGNLSTNAAEGTCSFFNTSTPADLWQFSLGTTTTVNIVATSSAFSPELCLVGVASNSAGTGTTASISNQSLGAGTYYIEVSSTNASVGGAYTLSLANAAAFNLLPLNSPVLVAPAAAVGGTESEGDRDASQAAEKKKTKHGVRKQPNDE